MLHTILIMSIIVFLCMCQPDELPPTATKMYASFILHTICHYLKRVGKIPKDKIINKVEQFPPVVCTALQQLEKTAFDGLVEDKIVFTVEDLPVLCKDDPTCYGLLQSTECYSAEEIGTPTQSFNFLHLGVQEYFAAKYVNTLPEDQVYTLLKESFVVIEHRDPDSKSVRLSNMWILYCGITSGQCKTLRHYLTTYGEPSYPHPVTPPTQPVYSKYPMLPPKGQHITSYPQPHYLPTVTDPRSHDPMLHPEEHSTLLTIHMINHGSHDHVMHNPSMIAPNSSHDSTLPSAAERYSTTTTSKHVNNNIDSQVTSEKMTGPSQQGSNCDQRISNTGTISQDILKDSMKVLYLFQCFQEAQDNVLCEVLSKSFDDGIINISGHRLLPHQVMSLGFFLSRSHRKWNELNLSQCINYCGMSILHQYLCGDKTNKQEITKINLSENNLTGASSHLIGDIISHLQPHTLVLYNNNITNVRDISAAVITTSTVKVLHMGNNGLTARKAMAISDMIICLEELDIKDNNLGDHGTKLSEGIKNTKTLRVLHISNNEIGSSGTTAIANALSNNTSLEELDIRDNNLGDYGAELLSEGITNTKTLRVLYIGCNNIGPSGTTAIANALSNNTSLEKLDMYAIKVGQDGATTIAKAIANNKTLKILSPCDHTMDKESAMIIIRSLHYNNTITELWLPFRLCHDDSVKREVIEINNKRNECNVQELTIN